MAGIPIRCGPTTSRIRFGSLLLRALLNQQNQSHSKAHQNEVCSYLTQHRRTQMKLLFAIVILVALLIPALAQQCDGCLVIDCQPAISTADGWGLTPR